MMHIRQAKTKDDLVQVREMFWEYLQWANQGLNDNYGINFDIKRMLKRDMNNLEVFYPPDGCLLLARVDSQAAGLACLKKIQEQLGEINRMYVRPEYRGKGVGRLLMESLINKARMIGYTSLRLDSTRFMTTAHALYRSTGFQEIEPYLESEIPPEFQEHWIFMEKIL